MPPDNPPVCPPIKPKEEKSFFGKLFDWTSRAKDDARKKECEQRRAQQEILQTEDTEWFTPDEKKFLDIKAITEEKLNAALFAINNALDFINSNPTISAAVKANGIKIQPPYYYIALAVKESKLNPGAKGNTGNPDVNKYALGYFQVKKGAMEGVNEMFGMDYSIGEIYSDAPLENSDQTRASINNAVVGILYWHLSEIKFDEPVAQTMSQEDRDKITAMIYFLGPSGFRTLYKALGKPKKFSELAKGIARHLSQRFDFLSVNSGGLSTSFSPEYGVEIKSYLDTGTLGADDVLRKLSGKFITINGGRFNAESLFEAIRYAEITSQLIHDKDLKAPERLSYKVRPKENLYKIVKSLLPRYGIELKDLKLEGKIITEIIKLINPNGQYDILKAGSEIPVPSKEVVQQMLSRKGMIHVVEKGEVMNVIAEKVGIKKEIPNLTRTRIHKLSDFLIAYNKRVNKLYIKKLMPKMAIYIPEKDEIEAAIS